jgi:RimJ/RimL family protein N-acetyltransferase
MQSLHTPRLTLRALQAEDAAFVIRLLNTPGWLQYIGNRQVYNEEQALAYMENGPLKSYAEHGFGLRLVCNLDGKPLGLCGLLKRPHLDCPDIGFAFLPEAQGLGYAHEAAQATLQEMQEKGQYAAVQAITTPDNEASMKLLRRLGFVLLRRILSPNNESLCLFEHVF